MGSKPWLSASILLLGGVLVSGCQNTQKRDVGPMGPGTPGTPVSKGTTTPPPWPTPGSPGAPATGPNYTNTWPPPSNVPSNPGLYGNGNTGIKSNSPGSESFKTGTYDPAPPNSFGSSNPQPPTNPNTTPFGTGYSQPSTAPVGTGPGAPGLPGGGGFNSPGSTQPFTPSGLGGLPK